MVKAKRMQHFMNHEPWMTIGVDGIVESGERHAHPWIVPSDLRFRIVSIEPPANSCLLWPGAASRTFQDGSTMFQGRQVNFSAIAPSSRRVQFEIL